MSHSERPDPSVVGRGRRSPGACARSAETPGRAPRFYSTGGPPARSVSTPVSEKNSRNIPSNVIVVVVECRRALVARPVHKKQAETFDRALRCVSHLLHLLLLTARSESDHEEVCFLPPAPPLVPRFVSSPVSSHAEGSRPCPPAGGGRRSQRPHG